MRFAFSLAYLLSLVAVLGLNFYAVKNPEKIIPLPTLLSRLLEEPANRLALGIIWWWLGWHFLYSSL